jgi:hypothetical protein
VAGRTHVNCCGNYEILFKLSVVVVVVAAYLSPYFVGLGEKTIALNHYFWRFRKVAKKKRLLA